MSIYHLLYVSRSTENVTDEFLHDIRSVANQRNSDLGITGLLLHCRGYFIQLLEGEKDKIEELFEKIGGDPRHSDIHRLACVPTDERFYPNWSMGVFDAGEFEKSIEYSELQAIVDEMLSDKLPEYADMVKIFNSFRKLIVENTIA